MNTSENASLFRPSIPSVPVSVITCLQKQEFEELSQIKTFKGQCNDMILIFNYGQFLLLIANGLSEECFRSQASL